MTVSIPITIRNKDAAKNVSSVVTTMLQLDPGELLEGQPLRVADGELPTRRLQWTPDGPRYPDGSIRWAQCWFPTTVEADSYRDDVTIEGGTPALSPGWALSPAASAAVQSSRIELVANGQMLVVSLAEIVSPANRILGTDNAFDVVRSYAVTRRMTHVSDRSLWPIWLHVMVEMRADQDQAQIYFQVGSSYLIPNGKNLPGAEFASSLTLTSNPTVRIVGCGSRFRFEANDMFAISPTRVANPIATDVTYSLADITNTAQRQNKIAQCTAPWSHKGVLLFGDQTTDTAVGLRTWDLRAMQADLADRDFPATGAGSIQDFPAWFGNDAGARLAKAIDLLGTKETAWDALGSASTPNYHLPIGLKPRIGAAGDQGYTAFGPQRYTILLRAGVPFLLDSVDRQCKMYPRHTIARLMSDNAAVAQDKRNQPWRYYDYQDVKLWLGNIHEGNSNNSLGIHIPNLETEGSLDSTGAFYEGPNRQHGTLTAEIPARFVSGDYLARRLWDFMAQEWLGQADAVDGYGDTPYRDTPRAARFNYHTGVLVYEGCSDAESRQRILEMLKRRIEMEELPTSELQAPPSVTPQFPGHDRRYWFNPTLRLTPFPTGLAAIDVHGPDTQGGNLITVDNWQPWQEAFACYGADMVAHLFDWLGNQGELNLNRWSTAAKRIAGEIAGSIALYCFYDFRGSDPIRNPRRYQWIRVHSMAGGTFTDAAARTAMQGGAITQAGTGVSGEIVIVTDDTQNPLEPSGASYRWILIRNCTGTFGNGAVTLPAGRTAVADYNLARMTGTKAFAGNAGVAPNYEAIEETAAVRARASIS